MGQVIVTHWNVTSCEAEVELNRKLPVLGDLLNNDVLSRLIRCDNGKKQEACKRTYAPQ
jgi:hypothetical protein